MSRSTYLRPIAAAAGVVAVAALGVTTLAVGQASAAPLPWQSGSLVDPNEKGTLALYDAQGNPVTSGSINAPLAAYAVGSADLRGGDNRAQLSLFTASDAQVPLDAPIASPSATVQAPAAGWTGETVTGSAAYPLAGGPTLPAGPVATIGANDVTLGQHIAAYPNSSSTAGYQNVYELRLTSSVSGQPFHPEYDAVDLLVNGSTWTVINQIPGSSSSPSPTSSASAAPTTLTLTSSSTTVPAGHPFVLRGTVSPAAAGTFQYFDGSTLKAKVAVGASGVAQYVPNFTFVSTHPVTVKFIPTDPAAFVGSTSNKVTVKVTKATPNIKVTWPRLSSTAAAKLPVSVTTFYAVGSGRTALSYGGRVYVYDGSKRIAAGTLTKQKVTLSLPKLSKGVHTIKVTFIGNASVNARTVTVKVTVR